MPTARLTPSPSASRSGLPLTRPRVSEMAQPAAVGNAMNAKNGLTYRVKRQGRLWVSTPPSKHPTAPRFARIAPMMRNARLCSAGSLNVVVNTATTEGASSAPNALGVAPRCEPPGALGETSMEALTANPIRPIGRRASAEHFADPPAQPEQTAQRRRVGGDDSFAVAVWDRPLVSRQRDIDHRRVEHHHRLRAADHGEGQPSTPVHGVRKVSPVIDARDSVW
jgi:hypothetical protein